MKWVRSILGVIVGTVVAMVLIMVFETINFLIYKPAGAPGVDEFDKLMEWTEEFQKDPTNVCEWAKTLPILAMVVLQFSWSVAAFAGGWVSARIAGWAHLVHAGIIGAVILANTVVNIQIMKTHGYVHPDWLIILGVLLPLPLSLLGGKLVSWRSTPPSPGETNP